MFSAVGMGDDNAARLKIFGRSGKRSPAAGVRGGRGSHCAVVTLVYGPVLKRLIELSVLELWQTIPKRGSTKTNMADISTVYLSY